LIAHATAPKRTAADTGMFARILSEELTKPGVEAFQVFREVQLRAKEAMKQEPWMSLNYIPRIYLAAAPKAPEPAASQLPQPVPPLSEAAEAWRILRESGNEAELEAFIKRFGETVFGDFARTRLAEVQRTKTAAAKPTLEAPKPKPVPTIQYEDAEQRLVRTFAGHTDVVLSVAFSPGGETVLSGSGDKTLKLWDIVNGRALRSFTGHTDRVRSVAISPNGRTALSGSEDKSLKLWDIASGRELRSFAGHEYIVNSVAISPDGQTALSGSCGASLPAPFTSCI
jgi:WD domain, G-beta repeat